MSLVKYNNNSISDITTTGLAEDSLVPIKTLTASASATLSFVDGTDGVVLDSTYPIYKFEFINIHPAIDEGSFKFNFSIDTGSNYNVTKTTTTFEARHQEDDSSAALAYDTGADLAQSTAFHNFYSYLGADADQSMSGEMYLWNPASTVFVKHFLIRNSGIQGNDRMRDNHIAGYANTTSAVDAIRFQMDSGNIDAGKIKLYGIKDS